MTKFHYPSNLNCSQFSGHTILLINKSNPCGFIHPRYNLKKKNAGLVSWQCYLDFFVQYINSDGNETNVGRESSSYSYLETVSALTLR